MNSAASRKKILNSNHHSLRIKTLTRSILAGVTILLFLASTWFIWQRFHEVVIDTEVLVVGAGIGGMSAAHEAGLRGAHVTVVEMNSVFGGNAVLSEGGLFIVDPPLPREL